MAETPPAAEGGSRKGMFGLVAVIGSALIGLNTLVTSCASESLSSNAARLHATEEDERFWTEAIKELSEISGEKTKADGNFEARCKFLAGRTAPFIAEVTSQEADSKAAAGPAGKDISAKDNLLPETRELTRRVEMLREEFKRYIVDEEVTSPRCRLAFEEALKRAQDDQAEKAATAKALAVNDAGNAAPPAGPSRPDDRPPPQREPLIALSAISDSGWDVDVFWCEDGVEAKTAENFARAYQFGTELADRAMKNQRLDGNEIGRVRVRRLAQVLWSATGEFAGIAGGELVRFGPTENGEASFADALARMSPQFPLVKQAAGGMRTRWYVSAYFCKASVADSKDSVPS